MNGWTKITDTQIMSNWTRAHIETQLELEILNQLAQDHLVGQLSDLLRKISYNENLQNNLSAFTSQCEIVQVFFVKGSYLIY